LPPKVVTKAEGIKQWSVVRSVGCALKAEQKAVVRSQERGLGFEGSALKLPRFIRLRLTDEGKNGRQTNPPFIV
jgi:hypothetical protein